MLRLEVSASLLSSVSSFASACQLPETSSSIANSVPRLAIRLSLMLPPDSLMTRVSSWTIPVRSLPIAETARCCFICGIVVGGVRGLRWLTGSVPEEGRVANLASGRRRRRRLAWGSLAPVALPAPCEVREHSNQYVFRQPGRPRLAHGIRRHPGPRCLEETPRAARRQWYLRCRRRRHDRRIGYTA